MNNSDTPKTNVKDKIEVYLTNHQEKETTELKDYENPNTFSSMSKINDFFKRLKRQDDQLKNFYTELCGLNFKIPNEIVQYINALRQHVAELWLFLDKRIEISLENEKRLGNIINGLKNGQFQLDQIITAKRNWYEECNKDKNKRRKKTDSLFRS